MAKQKSLEIAKQAPEQAQKFKEDLTAMEWMGVVIANDDPLCMGRCKIRVFEKFDLLDDDLIPWAFPVSSSVFGGGESRGCGSFSYPKVGSVVRVRFNNGDINAPEYFAVETLNTAMQSEIKQSYENSQVVVYDEDEDMKIIYTKNDGLKVWHKGSHVTIDKNTHITIEHVGGTSKLTYNDGIITETAETSITEKSPYINLDGSDKVDVGTGADDSATRCNALMDLLLKLAVQIDAKVPASAGVAVNLVSSNMANICSKIVWLAP